ncbi:MAG: aminotransferase class III-fold pyridoxal phosphate-dependent enzyme, partial [Pseudomonadota bacterium]
REITSETGTLLIFDEVVTGFRVSSGGAQAHYGVTPDLTFLAKILAGGMSGGAVAGREEILDLVNFEAAAARGFEKIGHPGTFNANPVSAAAGVAALTIVAEDDPHSVANARASELRAGLNAIFAEGGILWAAYGEFSGVHIFTNACEREIDPFDFDPLEIPFMELKESAPGLIHKLRVATLLNGVDLTGWPGCIVSAAHTTDDVRDTLDAFRESLILLRREEAI